MELFRGSAGVGTITDHRSVSGYAAAYLSASGTPDLKIVVEGALGPDGNYIPQENEWTVIQDMGSTGFRILTLMPTLLRFRVVSGTLERVVGNFYETPDLLPYDSQGVSATQVDQMVRELTADLASRIGDIDPSIAAAQSAADAAQGTADAAQTAADEAQAAAEQAAALYTPQAAPAATAAPAVMASPTKDEYDALLADVNALRAALVATGLLT